MGSFPLLQVASDPYIVNQNKDRDWILRAIAHGVSFKCSLPMENYKDQIDFLCHIPFTCMHNMLITADQSCKLVSL
ncbi:hypothetical protein XELAEV_18021246mg [Xenopus laevis]|uniref:Uncharacterized protein n=1 Tax=Xenopus laevis TaxID=8355 RepID=A0A974DA23_XENLA|nr:hypothetical protein XELAEV_18021246mg [Xenopus laevis]